MASLGADRRCERFFGLGDQGADDRVGRVSTSLVVNHPLHGSHRGLDAGGIRWIEFEFPVVAVHRRERGLRLGKLALQLIEPGNAGRARSLLSDKGYYHTLHAQVGLNTASRRDARRGLMISLKTFLGGGVGLLLVSRRMPRRRRIARLSRVSYTGVSLVRWGWKLREFAQTDRARAPGPREVATAR